MIAYVITRSIMAVAALMAIDTIANTSYAIEPTSILAMMGLILIAEILVAANVEEQTQQLSGEDIKTQQQLANLRALRHRTDVDE